MMQIIKPNTNYNFVGRRKVAFVLSGLLIIASIVSLIIHGGPKQGIDFVGGAEMIINFDPPVAIENVKAAFTAMGLEATVQKYEDKSGKNYRVVIAANESEDANLSTQIQKDLATATKAKVDVESYEMVGPQVGRDLQEKALLAIFFALLFITVYISGRF
jgi:preprotein translocase subunit SecF